MRLLIVEDDPSLGSILADTFRDDGYTVETARDGASGLAAAARGADLVLLDLRLPDRPKGIFDDVRRLLPDAEIIIMTANADLSSAISALSGGAFDYLTKPFGADRVLHTLSRARERVEMKRREHALLERLERSERTHRAIVESVEAAIFGLDDALRIRFANRAALAAVGLPAEKVIGADFLSLVARESADTRAQVLAAIAEARELALELKGAGGTVRFMLWRWARAMRDDQQLAYGIGADLTRILDLERQARVGERLAAAGQLTAGLAHEIKNPLNAALLQLSVLARELGKAENCDQREMLAPPLEAARRELVRLDRLLEDFLAFARPREYGKLPVRLGSVVKDVLHHAEERARQQGATLRAEIGQPVTVVGDAEALRKALSNLVANSLDAGARAVTIGLERENGRALISVEDDGPGIPPEISSRIFDPFFTTKSNGTGLGLSLVHAIVTAHDGTLGFTSRSNGSGTIFRVTLPS